MNLLHNWREVLRHAWSIRLMALAIALDVVAAVLPMLSGASVYLTISLNIIAGVLMAGAFVARFVAQKEFKKEST